MADIALIDLAAVQRAEQENLVAYAELLPRYEPLVDEQRRRTVQADNALARLAFLNTYSELLEIHILRGQGKGFTESRRSPTMAFARP